MDTISRASLRERLIAFSILALGISAFGGVSYLIISSADNNERIWQDRIDRDVQIGGANLSSVEMTERVRRAWPDVSGISVFPASSGLNEGNVLFMAPVSAGFACVDFDGDIEVLPYRFDETNSIPRPLGSLMDEVRILFQHSPDRWEALINICQQNSSIPES